MGGDSCQECQRIELFPATLGPPVLSLQGLGGGLKEVKTFSERSGANEGAEERSLEVFSAYHVVWG